jgi:decaprenylphospho-beta-D-ribofuranose 2-oxidase
MSAAPNTSSVRPARRIEPSGASPRPMRAVLAGWGRYPVAESDVYRPEKLAELAAIVCADRTPLVVRGAGRAYGDAAINSGGRVVDIERLNRMLAFDAATGTLRAEAGVTISEIIDVFLPQGYFPAVTPGTRFVTLGGAIAADVHGKNHHRDSSFGAHVSSFDLMLASGEVLRCSREENSGLFWATVGGMGLTGVIIEAEISLQAVESAYLQGELIRADNIDAAVEAFERTDQQYGYSMAWIDCASAGARLGRCVFTVGNFAPVDALPPVLRQDPLSTPRKAQPRVPIDFPAFALSTPTIRAFNEFIYRAQRGSRDPKLFDYQRFFYPLDSIRDWNRIYGKRGFVQYQCVWPTQESRAGLVETLEAIRARRRYPFLTVLKKFGAQEGVMSFPMPGYTLALDFPVADGLFEFLDTLDEMVLKRGGRVYLAKDARMRPDAFRAMYPNLARWQQAKASADPECRFSSSLARRIGMVPS